MIVKNRDFIKIFNINNDFFLSFRYFFKFNINCLINYENRENERS